MLKQQILDVRSDGGNRTYIITTRRITSGELLKHRNGEGGLARDLGLLAARYQPLAASTTLV